MERQDGPVVRGGEQVGPRRPQGSWRAEGAAAPEPSLAESRPTPAGSACATPGEEVAGIARLVDIVRRLRAPDGCPWDRAQTHRSLRRFVLEEAYEVVEAIDEGDPDHLADELGDLLLQVLLHAQIASESGRFTLADVTRMLADKLVRRHPHVFGTVTATSPVDVQRVWRESKRAEGRPSTSPAGTAGGETGMTAPPEGSGDGARASSGQRDEALPWVPSGLVWAYREQERAAERGDQEPPPSQAWAQLSQQLAGLEAAVAGGDRNHIEMALGQVLFTLVRVGRQWGVYPEAALLRAVREFRQQRERDGGER